MEHRILTNPVRLTGSIHPQQLESVVAVDALARYCSMQGEPVPFFDVITLSGDVAVQRAVQRAVIREGGDREELGREGFAVRARQLEEQAETDLQNLFTRLGLGADLQQWRGASAEAARTARVAFVRLYEAGLLSRTDAVLDSCPSCETVVDAADADDVEVDAEVARISLPLLDQTLEIDLIEPELLVGAVAVAVPTSLGISDATVLLPIQDREVPLVSVNDLEQPVVVVPGHDRWSYELARQLGFPVTEVLDAEGVVRHPGPLEGLARHAARAAAVAQLAAEGYLVAHVQGRQFVTRCHRCGTVLVPLLGRHWILPLAELIDPVVEAAKANEIKFFPESALDDFVAAADRTGVWAVSQQLWSGLPIPVYTCLDCNQTQVSVEEQTSCGACMGTLEAHTDVLDGRFVAVITPLAMMGWPLGLQDSDQTVTTMLLGRVGLESWALPVAALGLRLAGRLPFTQLSLYQPPVGGAEVGSRTTTELITATQQQGAAVLRTALLTGDFDFERARHAVELVDQPFVGDHKLDEIAESFGNAIRSLDASGALAMLLVALQQGIAEGDLPKASAMAAPLLGPLTVEADDGLAFIGHT